MDDSIDERLLKVVQLAKHGIGGEKTNAIETVKRMCMARGLEYDDVMNATDLREYSAYYKTKEEHDIIMQIIARFALTEDNHDLYTYPYQKRIGFKTTPAKYIETDNAISVYIAAFRREKKRIMKSLSGAFVMKHNLYPQFDVKGGKQANVNEYMRNAALASQFDDIEIQKQIGGGDARQ